MKAVLIALGAVTALVLLSFLALPLLVLAGVGIGVAALVGSAAVVAVPVAIVAAVLGIVGLVLRLVFGLIGLVFSAIGGIFGSIVLSFGAPALAEFALNFSSVEYFWLVVLGLTCAVFISAEQPLKGVITLMLGLLFGSVGLENPAAHPRFTFD